MSAKQRLVDYFSKYPNQWFKYHDLQKNTIKKILDYDLPFFSNQTERRVRELVCSGALESRLSDERTEQGVRLKEFRIHPEFLAQMKNYTINHTTSN